MRRGWRCGARRPTWRRGRAEGGGRIVVLGEAAKEADAGAPLTSAAAARAGGGKGIGGTGGRSSRRRLGSQTLPRGEPEGPQQLINILRIPRNSMDMFAVLFVPQNDLWSPTRPIENGTMSRRAGFRGSWGDGQGADRRPARRAAGSRRARRAVYARADTCGGMERGCGCAHVPTRQSGTGWERGGGGVLGAGPRPEDSFQAGGVLPCLPPPLRGRASAVERGWGTVERRWGMVERRWGTVERR